MQPQALIRVTGAVVGTRVVEYPPVEASDAGPGRPGGSYVEAFIGTPFAAVAGDRVEGMTAMLTIRGDSDSAVAQLGKGEQLDVLCTSYVAWTRARGRSFPVVVFRMVGPVDQPAARAA